MKSALVHALIALCAFVPLALMFGPAAGALAGIAAYWAREGAEAQWASRLPKSETWFWPWAPWLWPTQMRLDAAAPALALVAAWAAWVWLL